MEVYYCSWENHRNLWENMGRHHGKWRFSSLGQWSNKKAKNPWPVSEVACWSKACHPNPSVTSHVQVSQLQVLPPNWEAQRLALPGCSWHLHALAHALKRTDQYAKSSTAGEVANFGSFLLGNLPTVGTSNLPVLLVSPCTSAMDPPLNDGGKSLEERMMAFGRWNQRYHMATLSDLVSRS